MIARHGMRARDRPPRPRRDLRGRRRGARGGRARDRGHAPRVPVAGPLASTTRWRSPSAARCSSAASPRRTPASAPGSAVRRRSAPPGPSTRCSSTDLGQVFNPPVEDGLALMADRLLDAGFDEEEVHTMAVENTRRLAGVERGERAAARDRRALGRLRLARRRRGRRRRPQPAATARGDRAVLRRARRVGRAVEGGGPDGRERQARSATREAERAAARARRDVPLPGPRRLPARDRRDALGGSPTRSASSRPTCSSPTPTRDPFNPDHPVAGAAVDRARSLAAGAGVPSAFAT